GDGRAGRTHPVCSQEGRRAWLTERTLWGTGLSSLRPRALEPCALRATISARGLARLWPLRSRRVLSPRRARPHLYKRKGSALLATGFWADPALVSVSRSLVLSNNSNRWSSRSFCGALCLPFSPSVVRSLLVLRRSHC